jgi:hypothetical protein
LLSCNNVTSSWRCNICGLFCLSFYKKLEAWKPSVFMLLCFFCISVFNAKTLDLM